MSTRLKTLVLAAQQRGQGLIIATIPPGPLRKIFCPYCGQPYLKHPLQLAGAGVMQLACRNRWCETLVRGGHTETVVYFETTEGG